MTHSPNKRFLHIQAVASLRKIERWPGCGLAVICRGMLALVGLMLAGAAVAYNQQVLNLSFGTDTVYTAGIIGAALVTASLLLPSRWCRKMGESLVG